jgi:hypothetical protein
MSDLPNSERRIHRRHPVSFSCAEFGERNGGIVLNISQRGLALHAIEELDENELLDMRFQFSGMYTWIEARGRIVWTKNSNTMTGVEFVDLPIEASKQIQSWISLTSGGEPQTNGTRVETNVPVTATISEPISARPGPKPHIVGRLAQIQSQDPTPARNVRAKGVAKIFHNTRLVSVSLLAVVLWLAAIFCLGHYISKVANR